VINFAVRPGDDMLVEVWIGNAGSPPSLAGSQGVFLLTNLNHRRGHHRVHARGRHAGHGLRRGVDRGTANIIVRPATGIFGNQFALSDLANYSSAAMSEASRRRVDALRLEGLRLTAVEPRSPQALAPCAWPFSRCSRHVK
jgi:hypothetical protein